MKVLLATCAISWSVAAPERLSVAARGVLTSDEVDVLVSPISCTEVACASDRGRVSLDRHWRLWFHHFVNLNRRHLADIDLAVVEEAYSLPEPFHQDPADTMIVATARKLSCSVITADRKILDYPHVETVW